MINADKKQKIVAAVATDRQRYTSDGKHARHLKIKETAYSRVFNAGELDRVISDDVWMEIAELLKVDFKGDGNWVTAPTPTYNHIYAQLTQCQKESISLIFCDEAGIGKTYTATEYVKENAESILVDCSQCKSKRDLIKEIARQFRISRTGGYYDLYQKLTWFLNNLMDKPLIILDEAGDLSRDAFAEIKSLWNATESRVGWYMMGADGLKRRIERGKDNQKVGFVEIFDRYGKKYQSITQSDEWAGRLAEFSAIQLGLVVKANAPTANIQKIVAAADCSLRRVGIEINKLKSRE